MFVVNVTCFQAITVFAGAASDDLSVIKGVLLLSLWRVIAASCDKRSTLFDFTPFESSRMTPK